MATYKGQTIQLNQAGVNALNAIVQLMSSFPRDAESARKELLAAYNQYGEGLGDKIKENMGKIVKWFDHSVLNASTTVDDVSKRIKTIAEMMQKYIDSLAGDTSDDGHAPRGPQQETLKPKPLNDE